MMTSADNKRIAELASDRAVHKAFHWLHLHEQQLRRWQMEFLAIAAPPFREQERAQWFCGRFAELGLENARLDGVGNAVAELGEGAEVLLVSAHLDTVFPAGTDCVPRGEDARIYAPGACDNGAGLTGLLAIAAAMRHAEIVPKTKVVFCANVGEEGEGDLRGMRYLFGESEYAGRVRAAIALEGSGTATVVDRALGSRRLRVTVRGPGGHSWADAGLPNPILTLASALLSVANLPLPQKPRTTLNCGRISGGTSVNSIPEEAVADLDLRSTSAAQLDRTELAVLATLTETLATENRNIAPAHQMQMQVTRIGDRPAGELGGESGLARSLKAVDRHLKIATEPHIGSTDANLPLSLGVPALAIGCGGTASGIHTLQEVYNPTGRDLALRRILLLLLDACSLR